MLLASTSLSQRDNAGLLWLRSANQTVISQLIPLFPERGGHPQLENSASNQLLPRVQRVALQR
jgi:hypothetical protein